MVVPVLLAVLSTRAGLIATPAVAQDIAATRLPARVGRDFGRLAARTPLAAFGAGALAAAVAHPADARTSRALGSSAAAEAALDGGAMAGGSAVQFGIAGAVYTVGLAARRHAMAATGTALLEAQVVEGVIAQGLKYSVARTRPDGGRYSFPSGHTSSAFATADVILQRFGWRAGIPAYAGASYIGMSRLAERQHYLSDVLFGAAIGIASARAVASTSPTHRLAISPMAVRHGFALRVDVRSGPR